MSVFSEAVAAVQSALKLSDELRRTSQELKDVTLQMRDHDAASRASKHSGRPQQCCHVSDWNSEFFPHILLRNFLTPPFVSFLANRFQRPPSIEA